MGNEIAGRGEVLLYSDESGKEYVSVVFKDETFWLTQKAMAELFGCTADNISLHLKNIFADGELDKDAVTEKFSATAADGKNYLTQHYNLDAIIAVGYRVNSKKATRFRQWATRTLKEYIQKGFVLNDDLMKNGRPFGKDYFDELLERIREIRASERRAYQKIADVFEQCSYDYDKNSETTKAFYAFVQNKLHYAVTGKTAAELISERATLDSPTMGLTTWKGAPDGKILKSDTLVAKNYLNEKELSRLNRAGDHVHRLRRADGGGRATHEYAGLAERNRPISNQQPPQGAGWQGRYLAGSGGQKGRRNLRRVSQEAGCGIHLRLRPADGKISERAVSRHDRNI